MRTKNLLAVIALVLSCSLASYAADQLTLEHTFDGYYIPYNIPIYQTPADEDSYFYNTSITVDGNVFRYLTYNEDYSVRDDFYVTLEIPTGYKVGTIMYSPGMIFPDGRNFFIATFQKMEYSEVGTPDYVIANAYELKTGNKILSLGGATNGISNYGMFYVINGKISIIVIKYNYEYGVSRIQTCVYSLGKVDNAVRFLPSEGNSHPVRIITVDASGRLIDQPIPGSLSISQMSDGSTLKFMNK